VRAGLQFTPSDNFDWYVRADYNSYRNPQLPVRPYGSTSGAEVTPISSPVTLPTPLMCSVFGFCDRFPAYTSAPSFRAPLKSETDSIASIINFKTHSVVFTSVTGYRNYESSNNSDIEGLPINFLTLVDTHVKLHQFSQELRVLSQKNGGLDLGGRLDWVAGLYYFNAGYTQAQPVDVFGGAANGGVTSTSYSAEDQLSKAIFGHAEFHITDQWNVSAGVRQTWDDKTHDGIAYIGPVAPPLIDVRDNWKNFSKEFATSYMFDTSKMIYFRYAEGYRGGGMQGAPATIDAATPYQPETSRAFELGFKSDWLNHRLRVNADLYQTKYHDLQVDTYRVSVGGANLLLTQNAAAATIGGAEITTIIVPVEALTISANIGYIRARYDKFFADILGNGIVTDNSAFRFPFTPTWSGSLSVDYAVAHGAWGKLTVGGDYAYKSSQMLSLNNFPLALQSPYGVANFSLRFDRPSSRYYGVLYAQNAFDKQYLVNLEPISGNAPGAIDGMPRVFGIIVGAKF
jgi:iron complex outermembrane receptor protein